MNVMIATVVHSMLRERIRAASSENCDDNERWWW